MPYQKTDWKDHVVEQPNRYRQTTNPDGTVLLINEPGTVVQQGTPLSATHLNKIEDALESAFNFAEGNAVTVKNMSRNVIGLALEVETLKQANLSGVDANIFVEQFITLDDVELTGGLHDAENERIYLA